MAHELKNWKLKFEDLGGYVRAIKQKVSRKIKPQKHPFLKAHKLDKGWAEKLVTREKPKVTKGEVSVNIRPKIKAAKRRQTKKV